MALRFVLKNFSKIHVTNKTPRRFASISAESLAHVIGKREIVGFGRNGDVSYCDDPLFPFPSIRFREPTPQIQPLLEREKGDWRQLNVDEKRTLYRYSFCETYAEMDAPSGDWKHVVGVALILISLGIWLQLTVKMLCGIPLPASFDDEHQEAQLKRMLDLEVGAVIGLSSKWDYQKERWKE